jgi:hypothetical protein
MSMHEFCLPPGAAAVLLLGALPFPENHGLKQQRLAPAPGKEIVIEPQNTVETTATSSTRVTAT